MVCDAMSTTWSDKGPVVLIIRIPLLASPFSHPGKNYVMQRLASSILGFL